MQIETFSLRFSLPVFNCSILPGPWRFIAKHGRMSLCKLISNSFLGFLVFRNLYRSLYQVFSNSYQATFLHTILTQQFVMFESIFFTQLLLLDCIIGSRSDKLWGFTIGIRQPGSGEADFESLLTGRRVQLSMQGHSTVSCIAQMPRRLSVQSERGTALLASKRYHRSLAVRQLKLTVSKFGRDVSCVDWVVRTRGWTVIRSASQFTIILRLIHENSWLRHNLHILVVKELKWNFRLVLAGTRKFGCIWFDKFRTDETLWASAKLLRNFALIERGTF